MKTLHITNAWHGTSGGIATFYRALLQAAEAEESRMVLVVPAADDGFERVGEHGRIYYLRARTAPLNESYRMLMPNLYLSAGSRIQTILRYENPDLVEVSDKYSLPYLAGLLRRRWLHGYRHRPTVVGLSCERMDDNVAAYLGGGRATAALVRAYMKWLYFPMCDHHIAVSAYTAGELAEASRGHAQARGVWIRPMGVDCSLFRPQLRCAEARRLLLAEVGGGPDTVLLLYCGRLAREKNVELLPEALRLLIPDSVYDFRLILAGDGNLRERFMATAAAQMPGRIHFHGFLKDREALAALYANCDVFLHPNPKEPFGIAPLEAMASGLPLVAPDSGGVVTYANGSNAWLQPAKAERFAAAVYEILKNPDEARRRAEAARRDAEGFSWPAAAARYLKLYRELDRLTRGLAGLPVEPPAFFSTPGNRFGREALSR